MSNLEKKHRMRFISLATKHLGPFQSSIVRASQEFYEITECGNEKKYLKSTRKYSEFGLPEQERKKVFSVYQQAKKEVAVSYSSKLSNAMASMMGAAML